MFQTGYMVAHHENNAAVMPRP